MLPPIPAWESPTSSACKNLHIQRQSKGLGDKSSTGPDLHLHPELFYSAGYIIPPHSLAPPDGRAGMNNTEVLPHCQGWEHSRNGVLWVKRSSLEPLLQVRRISSTWCFHSAGAIPQLHWSWASPTPTAPPEAPAGPDPFPGDDLSTHTEQQRWDSPG